MSEDEMSDDDKEFRARRIDELRAQRSETILNLGELMSQTSTLDIECGSRHIVFKGSNNKPTPELKELIAGYLMKYIDEVTVELALLGWEEPHVNFRFGKKGHG